MRATIVIPSYWGRSASEPLNPRDAVYDHPTPIDEPGTLERALESISILDNRDFNVVVIAAATNPELSERVEGRVKEMVAPFRERYPLAFVSHSFEREIKSRLVDSGLGKAADMVSLTGYSNIRNMCLISAELSRSEVAVLFDDDEVYEDPRYLDRVFESMASQFDGKPVRALAGYYLRPEGGYLLPPPEWWLAEWPMVEAMNEAFGLIGEPPRLKLTPFVFGGNMCIHSDVFRSVPFDPNVRRGEDIDYLVNCRMFGIDFLLDNELSILHLPPRGHVPPWQHFRENVYRFIYAREKLRNQREVDGLRMVSVEELEPYPGRCMRDDLEDLIFRTSVLIGLRSLSIGDRQGFEESMKNIYIARYEAAPDYDSFGWYLDYQAVWKELMDFLSKDKVLSERMLTGI